MDQYDEFRIEISSDQTGRWTVQVKTVLGTFPPVPVTVTSVVDDRDLRRLRRATDWPDKPTLISIGRKVWASVLGDPLQPALAFALQHARSRNHSLRLVFVLRSTDVSQSRTGVTVEELPVEILHGPDGDATLSAFLGLDPQTPISRAVPTVVRQSATAIRRPLKIVVVVASPKGRPLPDADNEKQGIQRSLQPLVDQGSVVVKMCEPATRVRLRDCIEQLDPHIVHFIGHGDFILDDEGRPLPILVFEEPDTREPDPVDADTLAGLLRQTSVRLAVLTACSGAVPVPDDMEAGSRRGDDPLGVRAFDGVAQRLVAGPSGLTAAVGMQFDLDSWAAPPFVEAFYRHLLDPDLPIDEVVRKGRLAIVDEKSEGYRAWINPVVYFRCDDGKVFDFVGGLSSSDAARVEVHRAKQDVIRQFLGEILPHGALMRPTVARFIRDLDVCNSEQSKLFRDALRVSVEMAEAGTTIELRLFLRVGVVDSVTSADMSLRVDGLNPVAATRGQDAASEPVFISQGSSCRLVVPDCSGGTPWQPGEREIARVAVEVPIGMIPTLVDVTVESKQFLRGRSPFAVQALRGLVCVV